VRHNPPGLSPEAAAAAWAAGEMMTLDEAVAYALTPAQRSRTEMAPKREYPNLEHLSKLRGRDVL
jgi:hypothetical protein